jgi:4-hydroxy-2-oxoheptanedioate aldolase
VTSDDQNAGGDVTGPPHDAPPWERRVNLFKERLHAGDPALLMWVTLAIPEVPEMLEGRGLDAVILDLEHASSSLREIETMIRACDAAGITPLVRTPSAEPTLVTRLLDAGVYGIAFPMIQSRSDAEHAVACLRYQPRGLRGWGGAHTRHARWQGSYAGSETRPGSTQRGNTHYSPRYVEKAESDLFTLLIVETRRGVDAIDEIVAAEGVDAVLFGWGDYALECGFDWSRAQEAARRVYESCRGSGMPCALTPGDALGYGFYPGCFYVVGIDSLIFSAGLSEAVARARDAAGA